MKKNKIKFRLAHAAFSLNFLVKSPLGNSSVPDEISDVHSQALVVFRSGYYRLKYRAIHLQLLLGKVSFTFRSSSLYLFMQNLAVIFPSKRHLHKVRYCKELGTSNCCFSRYVTCKKYRAKLWGASVTSVVRFVQREIRRFINRRIVKFSHV